MHKKAIYSVILSFALAYWPLANSVATNTEDNATRSPKNRALSLLDKEEQPIQPSAVLLYKNRPCFLGVDCLWLADSDFSATLEAQSMITASRFAPKQKMIGKIPIEEFSNFVFYPPHDSLIILDKAGNLFEFLPSLSQWRLFRANRPFLAGSPDPDFVDLAYANDQLALLDPERNEIWKIPSRSGKIEPCFKPVLPWRVQQGEISVANGVSISSDQLVYIARSSGAISAYTLDSEAHYERQINLPMRPLKGMRPSRLLTANGTPLFVVERENNRVVAFDKKTGRAKQFLFPDDADLRGLLPLADRFLIINGTSLEERELSHPDSWKEHCQKRRIDQRLSQLSLPIDGMRLPKHLGVYPGARRLYRYGVHEGLDFFNDPGANVPISMGTEVRAAASGKLARLDAHFTDMNAQKFARVMQQCLRTHETSQQNEDLFRGCQIWIDHGNNLMTRYAHLSKINADLKANQVVNKGDLIGYVGVSGTGQNLPGRVKYPHLHFEIWLDGHYLGYGLTAGETVGIWEDIFAQNR